MSALVLTADQINSWVATLLWPLFRVTGLMLIMPVLGGGEVPIRVKAGLALAITLIIMPSIGPMPVVDPLSMDSVFISLQQLLIGIAMGLLVLIAFNAVTMAGESVAISMGLGFALMNDPQNGAQVPMVSQFYLVLAMLLFLSYDGHHAILMLLNSSFQLMPVGKPLGEDSFWILVSWGGSVFYGALAIALPALAAMLTVNITMGIITRAAPQLNIFSVGFPITMTIGYFAIMLSLDTFNMSFSYLLELTQETITQILKS